MKEYSYSFHKFTMRIVALWRLSGPSFTVSYLKEAHRLSMKAVGGEPGTSFSEPRVATRRGLPLIIPGDLRLRMEANDPGVVRMVLSLLTVYRIIKSYPRLKLETITGAFTGRTRVLPD
jgi:hypothetical protein